MAYENLTELINMCGSAKKMMKDIDPYSSLSLTEVVKVGKDQDWKREQWLQKLEEKKNAISVKTDAEIVLFECDDLRKYFHGNVNFADPMPLTAAIRVKAKSGIVLQESLNNPYIIAQASNVASYSTFIANIQAKYAKIDSKYPQDASEEERKDFLQKATKSMNKKIEKEQIKACERGFKIYQREMNLGTQIKQQRTKRWVGGTLAVLGAIGGVAGAAVTTASVVCSFGSTAVGAGFAIHGACKSLINTTIQLRSYALSFEKSLISAEADFKLMELTCRKKADGEVSTIGSHSLQAFGQIFVGDLAAPYKRAQQYVENADFKIAKIEQTLQDMGKQIEHCLNVIETSTTLFKRMERELDELQKDSEDVVFIKANLQVKDMQNRIAQLETLLNIMLVGAFEAATPVKDAIPKLIELKATLEKLKKSKGAVAATLAITLLGSAVGACASMGTAMANNVEWTNTTAQTASNAITGVKTGLAILHPSLDFVQDKIRKGSEGKTLQRE